MRAALLNEFGVSILKERRKMAYEGKLDPNSRLAKDFDLLLAFAEHVIATLKLDVSTPGAAFDVEAPDVSCEGEEQVMMDARLGDEALIYFGYYTQPRRYRMVAVGDDGAPCEACNGKGCVDWGGADCLSTEFKPLLANDVDRVTKAREIPATAAMEAEAAEK